MLSSKVSASTCHVEVGLVTLFWVLPSTHVLLPSIVIVVILSLSCLSPYSVRLWCLQYALPQPMNVNTMLNLQYVLSGQYCLHPLAIFPMKSCSHPIIVCCLNAISKCWGIVSTFNKFDIFTSIIETSQFPFQPSLICVSALISSSSTPASNKYNR